VAALFNFYDIHNYQILAKNNLGQVNAQSFWAIGDEENIKDKKSKVKH
jgi:hypothetical protein